MGQVWCLIVSIPDLCAFLTFNTFWLIKHIRPQITGRIVTNIVKYISCKISNSYTMGCPPVRGDNPRALASGLSYVQVDKHGITILYHLHQCRPCTSQDISC